MKRVNQYFKDRIELFDVIHFMYITGYNSLFQCTMIQLENYFINELNDRGEYILTEPL